MDSISRRRLLRRLSAASLTSGILAAAAPQAPIEDGVDLGRPITTTCGPGITASVLALALHLIGRPDVAVYDGSWTEWGGRTDTQVE